MTQHDNKYAMEKNAPVDLESKIIDTARELFTEKGFAETSMSDIAAKAGINRPVLHYYFRTKDRMFKAVFGSIVESLIPEVQDIISQSDLPVSERISKVVDAYYKIFTRNPCLPMFLMREMYRDFDYVENFVLSMHFDKYFETIRQCLQENMNQGRLKTVPMRFLFLTFYSLLTMPFSMKNLCTHVMLNEGETYEEMLDKWKPYVVDTMTNILSPDK